MKRFIFLMLLFTFNFALTACGPTTYVSDPNMQRRDTYGYLRQCEEEWGPGHCEYDGYSYYSPYYDAHYGRPSYYVYRGYGVSYITRASYTSATPVNRVTIINNNKTTYVPQKTVMANKQNKQSFTKVSSTNKPSKPVTFSSTSSKARTNYSSRSSSRSSSSSSSRSTSFSSVKRQ